MMEKVPYNYIGLMTFLNILKYENVRKIKKSGFDKYRDLVVERVKDQTKLLEFEEVDVNSFEMFLSRYSDIISYDGDFLYLDKDVSLKEIEKFVNDLQKEEDIDDVFDVFDYQRQMLNILGISSIYNTLKQYWDLERKIEDIYMNLDKGIDPNLKKYLLWRGIFLINFKNASDSLIDAIKSTSTSIGFEEDDFDYDDFPIDFTFFEHPDKYSKDKDDLFDDVSDSLFWIYQYAIFGDESLSAQKLWKDIDYIYMHELDSEEDLEEVEDFEEVDSFEEIDFSLFSEEEIEEILNDDSDEADYLFYLLYINKINDFNDEYGEQEELLKVKKRLLYALDKPELCLFKEDNFKVELEKTREENEATFELFSDEVRYMSSEVFLVPYDKNTLKKLLFISTYYELSEDEVVKDIIDSYSSHEQYNFYKRVVFGEQKSKRKA